MNALCFALILAQNAQTQLFPPAPIQDLMKKKFLYQIKQGNPDLMLYFDDATCNVVGTYNFADENFEIAAANNTLQLKIPYNDLIQGKRIDVAPVNELIQTKQNIIAAAVTNSDLSSSDKSASTLKKWLPWIAGAVGLSIGGIAIYNSMDRSGGSDRPAQGRRSFH